MVGIYSITSPSNSIYVGQSTNIKNRIAAHKSCKDDSRLYRSINKYGFDHHKVNILYELPHDVSQSVTRSGFKLSEEHKQKIRESITKWHGDR